MSRDDSAYRLHVASALRASGVDLSDQWLQSLKDVVFEQPWDIFPTEEYLDHVPSMIEQIGCILADRDEELALTNSIITRKATQLGMLRYQQDATISQLLREYDVLAQLLERFVVVNTQNWTGEVKADESLAVSSTVSRVVRDILQATVNAFVEKYLEQIKRQTDNLTSFNSFVSHELRSPLQAAMLNVDLLMETHDLVDENMQGLLATRSSIEQASSMLNNLQTLVHRSGVGKSETELSSQRVDLSAMTRDIVRQLQETIELRSVRIDIDNDLGSVFVETAKLKLVLANVLSNAIKYSDPKKDERTISVRRHDDGDDDTLALVIEDNGLGIEDDVQKKVFDLRFRAHKDHDVENAVDGHGIGLHLVAEAANDMNGTVSLESTLGEGTAVTIRLPRKAKSDRSVRPDPD